jgi:hypothetical protein
MMSLETGTLRLLTEALRELDSGFVGLPDLKAITPGAFFYGCKCLKMQVQLLC